MKFSHDVGRSRLLTWLAATSFALAVSKAAIAGGWSAAQPVAGGVPMDAAHWQAPSDVVFTLEEGFTNGYMTVPNKNVTIQDTDRVTWRGAPFADGTIEYDVKAVGGDGGGVFFRRKDSATAEIFYWRGDDNCRAADDCIQYVPDTHDLMQWELFPQYQSAAPIEKNDWNHFRLVFAGRRLAVYVNRSAAPSLVVEQLAGASGAGQVQVLGPETFANVSIRPGDLAGLPPAVQPAPLDPGMPPEWSVRAVAWDGHALPALSQTPVGEAGWRVLAATPDGLVNLSDGLGVPFAPSPAVAWLRTTIVSDRDQVRHVSFGWVRQAAVFLNGEQVFSGENLYGTPQQRFPFGRISLLNGGFDLHLHKGRNTLLLEIGNMLRQKATRYGWGAMVRLDSTTGVRFEQARSLDVSARRQSKPSQR